VNDIGRIRKDTGVCRVADYLMARGASSVFVRRLEQDLADMPDRYTRRQRQPTRREHAGQLEDLAKQTSRLASRWERHIVGRNWTVFPHLVSADERGGARCDRIEILRGTSAEQPTVSAFLRDLAEALELEMTKDLGEPALTRRMTLGAFALAWCLGRLMETGAYKRRPVAHAVLLASAATGKPMTTAAATQIIKRATRPRQVRTSEKNLKSRT
jgi:hypothetical protein